MNIAFIVLEIIYGGALLKGPLYILKGPLQEAACRCLERSLEISKRSPVDLMSSSLDSQELLYVLQHPARLLSRKNYDFWNFWTCPESKSMHFLNFGHFLENGSAGQTTMLTRRAAKFCVEPRSPFFYISHHDPKTLGKPLIIVSWPQCRP